MEDEPTNVYGIKIWGSPWQPWFYDWGFNLERGEKCLEKWNLIPKDTDILLTHGPPIGKLQALGIKNLKGIKINF